MINLFGLEVPPWLILLWLSWTIIGQLIWFYANRKKAKKLKDLKERMIRIEKYLQQSETNN
jgi:hypothetical protein